MAFKEEVAEEYAKYRIKYPRLENFHHAWGLLMEEGMEFFMEVCKKKSKRNITNARHELIQIAALCQCIAEDLAG